MFVSAQVSDSATGASVSVSSSISAIGVSVSSIAHRYGDSAVEEVDQRSHKKCSDERSDADSRAEQPSDQHSYEI